MLRLILWCGYTFVCSLGILIGINKSHVLNVHHVKFWSWCGWLSHLINVWRVYTLPLEIHILCISCLIVLLLYRSGYLLTQLRLLWKSLVLVHRSIPIESTSVPTTWHCLHLLDVLRLCLLFFCVICSLIGAVSLRRVSGRPNTHTVWLLVRWAHDSHLLLLWNGHATKVLTYTLVKRLVRVFWLVFSMIGRVAGEFTLMFETISLWTGFRLTNLCSIL